jgi:hypothetical protein
MVKAVCDQVEKERLRTSELFMFTDNSTAEAAFHHGTSFNPVLFELVLRLKKLEMSAGLKIHLRHVLGLRMIETSIDGLSMGSSSLTESSDGRHPLS